MQLSSEILEIHRKASMAEFIFSEVATLQLVTLNPSTHFLLGVVRFSWELSVFKLILLFPVSNPTCNPTCKWLRPENLLEEE